VCTLFYYLYPPNSTMSAQPARACKVAEPPAGDHKTPVEPLAAGTFDPRLEATAQASVHEYAEAFMLGFTLQDSMRASYMPRMGPSPVLTERGSPLPKPSVCDVARCWRQGQPLPDCSKVQTSSLSRNTRIQSGIEGEKCKVAVKSAR
jgi:hypothetical protein